MASKPKLIVIESAKLTRKDVKITYTQGEGRFTITEVDNPLPSFGNAFDALKPLVAYVLQLPTDYAKDGLRVTGIEIGSKRGARTIIIHAAKSLDDAMTQFEIKTPARFIETPTEEGAVTAVLSDGRCQLVFDAIEEARMYIVGERAQGQIVFEGDGSDGSDEQTGAGRDANDTTADLPLGEETPAKPKRSHHKKRPAAPNADAPASE